MRLMILAAGLCAAIAGCGPSASGGKAEAPSAPAGFPKPSASYAGTYQMNGHTTTIYADGARLRMEGPPPAALKAAGVTLATVMDQATKKLVTFRTDPGAPKAAMVMDLDKIGAAASLFERDKDQPNAKAVGEDKVAGLSCRIWETPAAEGEAADQVCVTDDGIALRMNKAGAADKPSMLAVDIRRGPQDPALFAPPADYEIVDYAPCASMAAEAMAAAHAGKRPDMAKLEACSALGQKVSAIYGQ